MKRKIRALMVMWMAVVVPLIAGLLAAVFVFGVVVLAQEGSSVASGGGLSVWGIVSAVLVPLLGVLSGVLGTKWHNVVKFLIELAEAVVAMGLALLAVGRFMEHPEQYSEADRRLLWEKVQDVVTEFGQAIEAGAKIWRRQAAVTGGG